MTIIQAGHYVLIKLPSSNLKMVVVKEKGTILLGKFGKFPASDIIGRPYGVIYDIVNDRAVPTNNKLEIGHIVYKESTEANNQFAKDDNENQKMTHEEIEKLKNSILTGKTSGKDIVDQVVANHAKFEEKTEFSKAKYIKRKENKFLRYFIPLVPTQYNIAEFCFNKNPYKIRELRMDTLSQILTIGNVRPGSRLLVVDDTSALLASSLLNRMGGEGLLINLYLSEFPNLDVMRYFNFSQEEMKPLYNLRFDKFDKDYVPEQIEDIPEGASETFILKHEKKVQNREEFLDIKKALLNGGFDGLFISQNNVDPFTIVDKLGPLLAYSRPIVIYSMYKEPLIETAAKMKELPLYLNPVVTESWLRNYQILPSRTHPLMTTSARAGYILSAVTVLDLGDSTPITSKVINFPNKRVKTDDADDTLNGEV